MENNGFWKGKRVLVTGAEGFIGSHLVERLVSLGGLVSVLVRGTSTCGTVECAFRNIPEDTQRHLHHVLCADIASGDTSELIVQCAPDIIFHLAAAAYVPYSFDHPMEVMAVNVEGTLHVLEAARQLRNLERVVCTSSSEVYGTTLGHSIDELHPLYPSSPYAASKVAADRLCHAYHRTYGLPIAIIRPFNTYGPRHIYDVIPKFIRQALENRPITIYGNGEQTRDFTYVDDTVEAFLVMGSHEDAIGREVNFGTGKEFSIKDVAHLVKEMSGSRSDIVHTDDRLAEVDRLCCNHTLASKLFGWKPRVPLEQGLALNIEWAKERWV